MAMTEEEKAIASGANVQTQTRKPRVGKADKVQNVDVVTLTGDELKQQTSQNIGALAKASITPMLNATNRTASQMLAVGVIQSMPQNIADATDYLTDFFDTYDSESLAFDLTMNSLPPQTQQLLTAGA